MGISSDPYTALKFQLSTYKRNHLDTTFSSFYKFKLQGHFISSDNLLDFPFKIKFKLEHMRPPSSIHTFFLLKKRTLHKAIYTKLEPSTRLLKYKTKNKSKRTVTSLTHVTDTSQKKKKTLI